MSIHELSPRVVALAGDWHKNLEWAKHCLNELPDEVEAVVHLGDFGYWPRSRGGQDFLDAVNSRCRRRGMAMFFVDGNHEDHPSLLKEPLAEDGTRPIRERVFHLPRGLRWEWNGVRFLALGGAASVDKQWRTAYLDWFPEEEITYGDAERSIRGGEADVMVCHDAPAGYRPPGIPPDEIWGDEAITRANLHRSVLRAVVDEVRPTHLFHGHFHTWYRRDEGRLLIQGLDQDGTDMSRNTLVLDMDELAVESLARRDLEER